MTSGGESGYRVVCSRGMEILVGESLEVIDEEIKVRRSLSSVASIRLLITAILGGGVRRSHHTGWSQRRRNNV